MRILGCGVLERQDSLDGLTGVVQHKIVLQAEDLETAGAEVGEADGIPFLLVGVVMVGAFKLNDEVQLLTVEIDDIVADGMLAAEV